MIMQAETEDKQALRQRKITACRALARLHIKHARALHLGACLECYGEGKIYVHQDDGSAEMEPCPECQPVKV